MAQLPCRFECETYRRISADFTGPVSTYPDVVVITNDSDPSDATTWEHDPSDTQLKRAGQNFLEVIETCPGPKGDKCQAYDKKTTDPGVAWYFNIDLEPREG
jgi:hypothetical protein